MVSTRTVTRIAILCLIVVVAASADADGADMVFVPGGSFQMGDTFAEGGSGELPVHTVYLSPFYIDRYEVTNQQYADALNWAKNQGNLITVTSGVVYKYNSGTSYPYCSTTSAAHDSPDYGQYSHITWNGSSFGAVAGKEDHPIVNVSWYGAVAFCNWRSGMEGKPLCYDLSTWTCNFGVAGYRLPTEAEWEKAARGDAAGHRFPWSDKDTIQHARANYYSSSDWSYDTSPTRGYHPTFDTRVFPYTSPVGYFAPNGYGVYDMAGNAHEWCNDRYASSYYSDPEATQPNPDGPDSGSARVVRGGPWGYGPRSCRVADRHAWPPTFRFVYNGFRCAVGTPLCLCGDLDGDGEVNLNDFVTFAGCFGLSAPTVQCDSVELFCSDLDGDGEVTLSDFVTFAGIFGQPPTGSPPDCGQ